MGRHALPSNLIQQIMAPAHIVGVARPWWQPFCWWQQIMAATQMIMAAQLLVAAKHAATHGASPLTGESAAHGDSPPVGGNKPYSKPCRNSSSHAATRGLMVLVAAHLLVASLNAAGSKREKGMLLKPRSLSPSASISDAGSVPWSVAVTPSSSSSLMACMRGNTTILCVPHQERIAICLLLRHAMHELKLGAAQQSAHANACMRAHTHTHLQMLPVLRQADHGHCPKRGRHCVGLRCPQEG
eukprot:1153806-Pelagomonas_calceolata.AAC.9